MRTLLKRVPLVLVVVGLIAAIVLSFRPDPIEVDAVTVTRGHIDVSVDEDGKTRIKRRFVIAAPLTGRMARIDWKPGKRVEKDKTLLTSIEPTLLDARAAAEAKARVDAAAARVKQARVNHLKAVDAIKQSEAKLKLAMEEVRHTQESYNRVKGLIGAAYEEERSKALFDFQRARQDEIAASFAVQMARKDEEAANTAIDIAEHERELAKAALILAQHDSSASEKVEHAFKIYAPIDGRVLRVHQESSRNVAAGDQLLEIGDPADLEVVIDVLSEDAVKIEQRLNERRGVRVILEQWGGAKPLKGYVRRVEPSGFTKLSALGVEEQRVNVIIDIETKQEERGALKDGFRVEARIIVDSKTNVVVVPTGAVFRHGKGHAVFVINGDRAALREVTVGVQDGLNTEIVNGLSKGERVVNYPSDKIEDDAKITIRAKES